MTGGGKSRLFTHWFPEVFHLPPETRDRLTEINKFSLQFKSFPAFNRNPSENERMSHFRRCVHVWGRTIGEWYRCAQQYGVKLRAGSLEIMEHDISKRQIYTALTTLSSNTESISVKSRNARSLRARTSQAAKDLLATKWRRTTFAQPNVCSTSDHLWITYLQFQFAAGRFVVSHMLETTSSSLAAIEQLVADPSLEITLDAINNVLP